MTESELVQSLRVEIESMREALKRNKEISNDHFNFLYRNLERMFWDDRLPYEGCKSVIMHYPAAPWNSKDWDWNTDHLPYTDKMKSDLGIRKLDTNPITSLQSRVLEIMNSLWKYGRFGTMGDLQEAVYEEAGVEQIKEGLRGIVDEIALNALLVSANELLTQQAELPVDEVAHKGILSPERLKAALTDIRNISDSQNDDTTDNEENIA